MWNSIIQKNRKDIRLLVFRVAAPIDDALIRETNRREPPYL
jgi:hypothetical protein